MEKTTVYLPADLQAEVKRIARRQGRPQAEVVREALTRYVVDQPAEMPTWIGSVSDGTLDASEAKKWVRDRWSKRDAERQERIRERFGDPDADA